MRWAFHLIAHVCGGFAAAADAAARIIFRATGPETLFHDFNAQIPAGKLTAIIGGSGKGKTTLIDIIAGLQKPVSGHILIDGTLLDESLYPQWKNSIGYLPQDAFFIDGSIRENLVWDSPATITDNEIMEVLEKVNAAELINRQENGLETLIVNHQYSFSGGERQRLALARTLLHDPHVLLLDEPFTGLDRAGVGALARSLARAKAADRIVIVVTHEAEIAAFARRILRFRDGRLIADDQVAEPQVAELLLRRYETPAGEVAAP